jgi:S-adenosylmethionine-dependent methyltransferase
MASHKQKVKTHYDSDPEKEWNRLDKYKIEFQVTLRHLYTNLKPNSTILDVSGGPGRYAFSLTKAGHQVHHTDLSSGNVDLAKLKEKELGVKLLSSSVMDAEDLSDFPDESFDAVINFGSLYHLQNCDSRNRAISETLRVTKKGGIAAFAFLSIYAPIYDVLKKDPSIINYRYEELIKFVKTGIHVESEEEPGFTDIFLIDPTKIEDVFKKFPVNKRVLFGAEGLSAQSETKLITLSDQALEKWIELAYITSNTVAGINCSEHIVYIGEKI